MYDNNSQSDLRNGGTVLVIIFGVLFGRIKENSYLDGASILKACKWLKAKSQPRGRIAG